MTACALIHHNFDGVEKVFAPRRADTKKFLPGIYELLGGHIDFGEDIVEGLKREIKEEFGMDIEVGDPFSAFTYTNEIKGSHSIEVIYFARFIGGISKIQVNPEDHSGFVWVTQDNFKEYYEKEDAESAAVKKGFDLLSGGRLEMK